jgi:hypothetical protein
MLVDAMAVTYHVLPSKLLEEGNTLDIQLFTHVSNYRDRERKLKAGEDVTGTYRPEELEEIWQQRTQK